MELLILPERLSVLKLSAPPDRLPEGEPMFFSRTGDELSLCCVSENAPAEGVAAREDGWRAFRISGSLDFSLCGILAALLRVLAEEGISVFTVSTYDTDYILVKEERLPESVAALTRAGHRFL